MIVRFCTALFLILGALSASAQESGTILILDGSGSMWAELPEGRSRIEVARDVLDDFLSARDSALPLGVIAYGHNRSGDCSDIETIAPVASHDGAALGQRLRTLMPRGKTPLADALRRAASEIPQTAEEADIVLVTDGLETCGGDPCAVAAELAAQGIPIRAHVVGFGLTEGEVQQISCVADQTGGLILNTQSGEELSDALLRTASAPIAEPVQPGTAAINLTIRADIAGRPDQVMFRAVNEATGDALELGVLDFSTQTALSVELAEGNWLITADAGDQGNGEVLATIVAGDNTTIYVPFRGLLPTLDMPAPTGAFRAGVNGLIPYRILAEGLATGGGDFIFSLLPVDATDTYDRRIDYATQESREGGHVGSFRTPAEPGDYLLAFHRNGQMPIADVMERFVISVATRPEVTLIAPPAVAPGARVPVTISGGMGNGDRIEIWRDGARYSWDQSIYLQDFFDNRYGPAKPLLAPSEPGDYELVYVFSGIDGPEAVAARSPLMVGDVPELDEAAVAVPSEDVQQAEATEAGDGLGEDVGYACAADSVVPCFVEDTETGLVFFLPQGWITDYPTREAATAGGQPGLVRVSFFSTGDPVETIVLNPHQWITMNGPCVAVQAGDLCQFQSDSEEMSRAMEILVQSMRDLGPPAGAVPAAQPAQDEGMGEDPGSTRAWADYPFRCLPDDKTEPICEMRHDESGLTFFLPENWVADVSLDAGVVRAEFFEVTGAARSAFLNPEAQTTPENGCFATRAGNLCTDISLMDEELSEAIKLLRRYMTTGDVLRNCGNESCTFALPAQEFSGMLPPRWGVEIGQYQPDGRISTWFYGTTSDFELTLIGLNQPGGDNCRMIAEGVTLCEHTPYISSAEFDMIAANLSLPGVSPRPAPELGDLDESDIEALSDILDWN